MPLHTLTIEVEAESPALARTLGEQAGFTVKRVARPTVKAGSTTLPNRFMRANAVIDRPANLTPLERKAYLRGYAAGCLTYVKKRGIPRGDTYAELVQNTKEAEWDRHSAAHKKGMAELAAWRLRNPWDQAVAS